MRTRADGFSLIETLAALALSALLATALLTTAVAQLRLARAVALRAASADAVRTTSWVLAGEARRSTLQDVHAWARDSLALRVFRGRGIVCTAAGNRLLIRYTGDRLPDAAKDSVLAVGASAERTAALLNVREPDAFCATAADERLLSVELDRPLAGAAVLLLFETGSYYLSARALRFRSGAEGRQPITPEVFAGAGSRFTGIAEDGIRFSLAPDSLRALRHTAYFPAVPRQ